MKLTDIVFEILRHILTLSFGVFVSAIFLDIRADKKNLLVLCAFLLADSALQGLLYLYKSITWIVMIYPLITHIPILLIFVIVFKKGRFQSVIAVTTAYLCCQVANWFSVIPLTLIATDWAEDITYTVTLLIKFLLIIKFVAAPFSGLLSKLESSLISFSIVPVCYYIFDYISTVYTGLLYDGNLIAVEFPPFLLCIWYIVFCTVYFKKYEEEKEIENRNRLIQMKYDQSKKEIETIKRNEKTISLLRHDMRHFLSVLFAYVDNGETEKAKEYIHEIIHAIDTNQKKIYCANDMINMILSYYGDVMEDNNIEFVYRLKLPKDLGVSDVDMTSILSNSLENAIHEVLLLEPGRRIIELSMAEKGGKLLISLENACAAKPVFVDGIPISGAKGHGLGTQSIQYTVEKLNGNCHFSVMDDRFVVQIVL